MKKFTGLNYLDSPIVNYYRKDDKIIVTFSDGSEIEVDKNATNEKNILLRLRNQVMTTDKMLPDLKNDIVFYKTIIILMGILSIVTTSLALGESLLCVIGSSPFVFIFGVYLSGFIKKRKLINTIMKNRLFIKDMDSLLNLDDSNSYDSVLANVSKKTKNMFLDGEFDLEKLDKMSYKDMKTIDGNIEAISAKKRIREPEMLKIGR